MIRGIRCPQCQATRSKVADTRKQQDAKSRRRVCEACGHRFSTVELVCQNDRIPSLETLRWLYVTQGLDLYRIAALYNLHFSTVRKRLKTLPEYDPRRGYQLGADKRRKLPSVAELITLHKTHGLREIAEMYNVTPEAVLYHLLKSPDYRPNRH